MCIRDSTGNVTGDLTGTADKATDVVGAAGRVLYNSSTDDTTTSANLLFDGTRLSTNNVLAQNVKIAGSGANEIDTSSGNLILDAASNTVQVTTNLLVSGTGEATDSQGGTGALQVKGGVEIAKKLFVGGAVDLSDTLNVDKESTFLDDVALSADGKTFKVKNAGLVDKFTITSDDGNTDIKGTLVVAGVTSISNTTQSIGIETGALIVKGGVGIGSSVYIGGDVKLLTNLRIDGDLDVDGHTELDDVKATGVSTFTNIVDLELSLIHISEPTRLLSIGDCGVTV